jgi:hypothetical protein
MTAPVEKKTDSRLPPPGHPDARWLHCNCPVTDNCNGEGYRGDPTRFLCSPDCPLHGDHPKVVISECGPKKDCQHKWDGPTVSGPDEGFESASCSLCGTSAIDDSLWNGL